MRFWFSLLSLIVTCAGCGGPQARAPSVSSAELPKIPLLELDRRPTTLFELARGRPALVALWATWCEGCQREFDSLNRLHERVAERALVVGVAEGESNERVQSFLESRALRYAQLVDERFALATALGSNRLPTTLVLDPKGGIRHAGGELDPAALAALRDVLSQGAISP